MKGIAEANRILRKGKSFWLSSHLLVDGDGLGSLLALALALKKKGKEVYPVNQGPFPRRLKFLPGFEMMSTKRPRRTPDGIITLDTPVLDRLGVVKEWLPEGVPIINLDHHISNSGFGQVNIVEPGLSSTGEVVYNLLREGDYALDEEIATNLFTAIYTDTGRFSYGNTSAKTLEIAAHLLRKGATIRLVSKWTYESKRKEELELQARAIGNLAVEEGGRVAWSHLKPEDFEAAGCRPEDGQDLVDIPRSLEGVSLAIFFRVAGGKVRVSFRSEGEVNVAAIAEEYGGGGHKNSAGCTIEGPLEETMDRVVLRAREAVNPDG